MDTSYFFTSFILWDNLHFLSAANLEERTAVANVKNRQNFDDVIICKRFKIDFTYLMPLTSVFPLCNRDAMLTLK